MRADHHREHEHHEPDVDPEVRTAGHRRRGAGPPDEFDVPGDERQRQFLHAVADAEWEVAASGVETRGNFLEDGFFHPVPAGGTPATGPAQMLGNLWEWTQSPYVAYPGYRPPEGALGEYNG